jgi:hypothetical protein
MVVSTMKAAVVLMAAAFTVGDLVAEAATAAEAVAVTGSNPIESQAYGTHCYQQMQRVQVHGLRRGLPGGLLL